jgi:DNA adenine methylase
MKTLVKYQGGKSREMKFISSILPSTYERTVEPFAGSAAFSVALETPALLSDLREDAIAFFQVLADQRREELKEMLDWAAGLSAATKDKTKEELAQEENLYSQYYFWRDEKFGTKDPVEQAFRFVFLRTLCFSGMERVNAKTGKSNVPFGWYGNFNPGIVRQWDKAVEWSKGVEAHCQPWEKTLGLLRSSDFLFLDPPYLNRLGYEAKGFEKDEDMHRELASLLKEIDCKWMMVHVDCPEYREMYSWAKIIEKPYTYSLNFKGRQNKKAKVGHLYIVNY